jgi:PTS system N-acetylglucosamine-specific IIC component
MSGFFPVMMFGLPAACLAMYRTAQPARREAIGGMLFSMALTSFLTGVTEPIEFSFMFLAPVLYALHAVLTGVAMAGMDVLGVRLGFGFSAGLFDYVLNFKQATRPLLLIPAGLAYFGVYYALFHFFIVRFNLKTPGRDLEAAAPSTAAQPASGAPARQWVTALGGAANLRSVDACTTRLRLVVANQQAVDEGALKALGARGCLRSEDALQVVVGPIADQLAAEIRSQLKSAGAKSEGSARDGSSTSVPELLAALGGAQNVKEVLVATSRVLVTLHDAATLNTNAIARLGLRGIAQPMEKSLHLLVGPNAAGIGAALLRQCAISRPAR